MYSTEDNINIGDNYWICPIVLILLMIDTRETYEIIEDVYLLLKSKGRQPYKSEAGKRNYYHAKRFEVGFEYPDDFRYLFVASYGSEKIGILESYLINSI